MRCSALKAKTRRGFRLCRNAGNRASGVAENLLLQEFSPAAPNRCWAGDITTIRTTAGWRYLAVWIDLYSRRVVGWAMGVTMEATLVLEALNRALGHRLIKTDQLLVHTDQGSQPGFKGLSQRPFFLGLTSDDEQTPKTDGAAGSTRLDAFAG
jgi:transposase InsO family protein